VVAGAQIEDLERAGRRKPRSKFSNVRFELRQGSREEGGSAAGGRNDRKNGNRDGDCNAALHENASALFRVRVPAAGFWERAAYTANRASAMALNPWRWLTDRRLTFALKLVGLVVLVCYAAQFAFAFLAHIRAVVYIVIGTIFLAYLIYPAVHRLRRRMPLALAILLVYATIVVGIVAVGWFVVPHATDDIRSFVTHYPELSSRINSVMYDPNDPLVSRLPDWMRAEIARIPAEFALWVKTRGIESAGHLVLVLAGGFAAVATFIIVPLMTAYLMLDLENLQQGLASIVPQRSWRSTLGFLRDVDAVIGGFIRGQLLVALSVGVLITVALLVLHVRYAFFLGMIAAIGDLVPYVGALLAFLPAFTIAWVNNGIVNALLVLAAFVVIFEAEGHLLAPNIVSKTVRLSPFVVLLALLIGGDLGGIVGLLVAIPVAGILRVIALRVFRVTPPNEPTP
jgi:predicted PurR-regulated permease PerM